jgi:hypothetical protein
MRYSCNSTNSERYKNYGAKGIKVCERWSKFENFLADMGERPPDKNGIGRIDEAKDFTPENTVWIFRGMKRYRTDYAKKYEYRGSMYTIHQLAEFSGHPGKDNVPYNFMYARLKSGLSTEDAVKLPIGSYTRQMGPRRVDINAVECTCSKTEEKDPMKHSSGPYQCRKYATAYQRLRRERMKAESGK